MCSESIRVILTVYSCETYYAHPGDPLKDHLDKVGLACKNRLTQLGMSEEYAILGELVGKTHDVGKYTKYFQTKLTSGKAGFSNRELYSHAPLSSIFAAYSIFKKLRDPYMSLIGSYCVWYHHRNIETSLQEFCLEYFQKFTDNENYRKQLQDLMNNSNKVSVQLEQIGLPNVNDFAQFVENDIRTLTKKMLASIHGNKDFIKLILLFSVLIDSDKRFSAGLEVSEREEINYESLSNYIDKISSIESGMTSIRNEIRRSVISRLKQALSFENIPRVYTLASPTGTGKTLLSFECSLLLRQEVFKREKRCLRIIYVLPFINIIEQTYSVISNALDIDSGSVEQLRKILKHHHLYVPDSNENEDISNSEKLFLTDSWDSEIVVTTFVQFMETLIGTKNRMLKKFNKIIDSIIILDEVQNIRPELWRLTVEMIRKLSEHNYIIMMSATMPSIFSENTYPLLEKNYSKELDRLDYIYIPDEMDVEKLAKFVLDKWEKKSVLVITNRIKTSIALYEFLKNSLTDAKCLAHGSREGSNFESILGYLSTNIIPADRLARINVIQRQLCSHRPVILISTQVVEAGVDLDFDMVVRDIAPLDSIVQSGGRCNRNLTRDKGKLFIVKIKNEREELDATRIYSSLSISKLTLPFLDNHHKFSEKAFQDTLMQYYEKQLDILSVRESGESKQFLKAIQDLDLPTISGFKVIKESPKASVFINIDVESENRRRRLLELWQRHRDEPKNYQIANDLRIAWVKAREFVVDTWSQDLPVEQLIPDNETFGVKIVSGAQGLSRYYDTETGLRLKGANDAIFI